MAAAAKHFPGDGVDERNQHIVTSINSLSCEAWDESYGKIYKSLIDAGLLSIMVGQIALPAYEKKFRTGHRNNSARYTFTCNPTGTPSQKAWF